HRYGKVFPLPYAFNYEGEELVKIMSLDGKGKMSKSENQSNTLYLSDGDELIRGKIMKARTDNGPTEPGSVKPDFIAGLFDLMKIVSRPETLEKFEADFNKCTIRYGDMKKQLAEDMVKFIAPLREKISAISNDYTYLAGVMEQGAVKARASAKATLQLVKEAMGLNYL
ncbi:MAG TPA: tryptophan--tRNA ligase, partial [Puia sp.]|nr:tryptophan--tRNA ligase [Puia sp.]